MRIKRKVKELKNADVEVISLVKRGANRSPIKIQKTSGERDVGINLGSLFLSKKNETVKASVAALVFPKKPENVDALKALVEKSGFKTDKPVEEKDGTFVYAQVDKYDEGTQVIRYTDDLIVVTKGFVANEDFLIESGDTKYFPGLADATNGLREALVTKSEDSDETVAAFGEYVKNLNEGLPESVQKFAKELSEENAKVAKAEKEKAEKAEKEKADAEAAKKAEEAKVKKEMTKPDNISQDKWDSMSDEQKAAACAKSETVEETDEVKAIKSAVEGSLKTVTEQFARMTETMSNLAKTQEEFTAQIAEIAKKSDELEKKLKGTVPGSTRGDDPTGSTVRKSEAGPFMNGSFDTAMSGFSRRK